MTTIPDQIRAILADAKQRAEDKDNICESEMESAEKESKYWEREGDMYGKNFHEGRWSGMNAADIRVQPIKSEMARQTKALEVAVEVLQKIDDCMKAKAGIMSVLALPEACEKAEGCLTRMLAILRPGT